MSPAAAATNLPCDGEGLCMACKVKPHEAEVLICRICATPWHVPCLSAPPSSMSAAADWQCPDCDPCEAAPPLAAAGANAELVAAIRAIEADGSLTEQEKARRRQAIVSKGNIPVCDDEDEDEDEDEKKGGARGGNEVLDLLDEKVNCAFCMQLPERPVTSPCGHNFCLKCFQKWVGQGKRTCAKCRTPIPSKMASQPRINSALVVAIRMAKTAKSAIGGGPAPVIHFMRNENRPEKAFTTDRAKKPGKANACSGQIFVTVPPDHFGPILAENDPRRNQGVLVGETWEDRMECRQWGAHLPHVAGIAGQSDYGAQSVALSGGYEDDEDHGEWFLYTGSGGRDLSGNKRTNKEQAFDQKFEKLNAALKVSCLEGYPVRVVRSHKEKRSSYAPDAGVRYDGIYRIEKCWRKVGIQGYKVCRYLFVRCDNEPAPWTSDEHGDRPRPLPVIKEMKNASDVTLRKRSPAWDYDSVKQGWTWMRSPPHTRKSTSGNSEERKYSRKKIHTSMKKRLLKEFSCLLCRKVMTLPLSTPCGHNFCKSCLLGAFADTSFMRERSKGGRTLRTQKIIKQCPSCPADISDFLQNPQVNRDLMELIESLQCKIEEEMENQIGDDNEDMDKSGDGTDGMHEHITGKDIVKDGEETKLIEEESDTVGNKVDYVDEETNIITVLATEKVDEALQTSELQFSLKKKDAEPDVIAPRMTEHACTKDDLSHIENSDSKNDMPSNAKENIDINVADSRTPDDDKALLSNHSTRGKRPVRGMLDRSAKKPRRGN